MLAVPLSVAVAAGGGIHLAAAAAFTGDRIIVDLSVAQTGTPDSLAGGGQATYSIVASNLSVAHSTRAGVLDTLPAGSTLVSATPSQGICAASGPVKCGLGVIPPGGSATVEVVVETACAAEVVSNDVTLVGRAKDPNHANNVSSVDTTVTTPCVGVTGEVTDGGTVTTDPDGQGPQPEDGVFETTSVTVPTGVSGNVSIDLSAPAGECPGFTALVATTEQPAAGEDQFSTLVFTYAACAIPEGTNIEDTTIQWTGDDPNGDFVSLETCEENGEPGPDPCVASKQVLDDGDFQYTVSWSGTEDPSWRPG